MPSRSPLSVMAAFAVWLVLTPLEPTLAQTKEPAHARHPRAQTETYGWAAYGMAALIGYAVYAIRQKRRSQEVSD